MSTSEPNDVAPAAHKPVAQAHAPRRTHWHYAHAHHPTSHTTARSTFHNLVAHAAQPRSSTSAALSDPAVSNEVTQALRAAMEKEGVPSTWESSLQFIVGHESGGQVNASNQHDSARGLFQLTRASYELNPNGAQSFGNAVEEAQGGIRYIRQRYQTADNAVQFWQRHRYY